MSEFDDRDVPPDLSDVAELLRSNRYEAGELELDQIKTRILKRGSGRRVARGRRMRKRTFVTALIMFAAIGTGSAGAVGFGGGFASFAGLFSFGHAAPAIKTATAPKAASPAAPTATCGQYTCPTTTTVSCPPVVVIVFGTPILPATCTVTVTNTMGGTAPTGTVTVTATGAGTQTCTLVPDTGNSSTCTVTFGHFNASLLGVTGVQLFSTVTANYLGDSNLAPSSGSTTIIVVVQL